MTIEGALWIVAAATTSLQLVAALAAAWARRPRAASAAPREEASCAVVVPSKGVPAGFERNLEALARQRHPAYRLYLVVESEADPGLTALRALCARHPHASVVVAGLSRTTCQQNHNMLAGVRAAGAVEVLAFADNDVEPRPEWLAHLVAPLADPAVGVTTGYRWLVAPTGRWSEQPHVAVNLTMYAWFLAFCHALGKGLWGGSFAMRRRDLDRLDVESVWDHAVSDDLTLMDRLAREGLRARFVPEILLVSEDVLVSPREAMAWFERQLLNVKAHARGLWRLIVTGLALEALPLVALPVAAAAALLGVSSFGRAGGIAALAAWAGECVVAAVLVAQGPTRGAARLVAAAPLLRLAQTNAALRTLFRWSLTWSGVTYHFDRAGRVERIVRWERSGPARGQRARR